MLNNHEDKREWVRERDGKKIQRNKGSNQLLSSPEAYNFIFFYNLNVEIMFGDGKNKAHKKLLIKKK